MKKVFTSFVFVLATLAIQAQSERFRAGMESNIALLESAKTTEDFTSVAAAFERIGDAEKSQWLPYYYAALANIWKGFADPNTNKDEAANKADALIAKAESLEPKNAEIMLEKSMSATLHMLVDPAARWQQYGAQVRQHMEAAKKANPENPRIYFWEGQNLFGTPAQFGGGKENAKPLFEKSIALFKSAKTTDSLYPNWGQKAAEQMLEKCK